MVAKLLPPPRRRRSSPILLLQLFHLRPVLQLPQRAEGAGHDLLSFLRAAHELDGAVAGEAGLDRLEFHRAGLVDEDSLLVLRFSNGTARFLADDQRLNGDGQRLRPRAGDDVRRDREAGPYVRRRILDVDLDLEVHSLCGARGDAVDLDGTRCHLGDETRKGLVGIGVDGDAGVLADLDRRDVGLVDFHHRFDHAHVRDRHQHRAGVVHRADYSHFALFDRKCGDDAGHRRAHGGFGERVVGGGEVGARLADALLQAHDVSLRGVARAPGAIEVGARNDLLVEVSLRTLEVLIRGDGGGFRGIAIGEDRLQRRVRPLGRCGELLLVDLQEEIALLDDVALAHGKVDYLSHHVRRQVDFASGVDVPVRRDFAGQILSLHFAERDGRNVLAALRHESGRDRAGDDQHDHSDDDLRTTPHEWISLVEELYGNAVAELRRAGECRPPPRRLASQECGGGGARWATPATQTNRVILSRRRTVEGSQDAGISLA